MAANPRGSHPCLSPPVNMSKEIPICQSMGDLPDPYGHFNCGVLLLRSPEASLEDWKREFGQTQRLMRNSWLGCICFSSPCGCEESPLFNTGQARDAGTRIQQQPTEQMKRLTFIDFRGEEDLSLEESLSLEETSLCTADEPRHWIG